MIQQRYNETISHRPANRFRVMDNREDRAKVPTSYEPTALPAKPKATATASPDVVTSGTIPITPLSGLSSPNEKLPQPPREPGQKKPEKPEKEPYIDPIGAVGIGSPFSIVTFATETWDIEESKDVTSSKRSKPPAEGSAKASSWWSRLTSVGAVTTKQSKDAPSTSPADSSVQPEKQGSESVESVPFSSQEEKDKDRL